MVVTKDTWIPTYEELTVEEIPLTTGPMLAAAHHMGKYCDNQCKEFMLCWNESIRDPRKCLKEGNEVTSCGLEFLRKVKRHCAIEFSRYSECVEKRSSHWYQLHKCRSAQKPFDDCILKNLGQERPEVGYFSRVRLHESSRKPFEVEPAPMPEKMDEFVSTKFDPNDPPPELGFHLPHRYPQFFGARYRGQRNDPKVDLPLKNAAAAESS